MWQYRRQLAPCETESCMQSFLETIVKKAVEHKAVLLSKYGLPAKTYSSVRYLMVTSLLLRSAVLWKMVQTLVRIKFM